MVPPPLKGPKQVHSVYDPVWKNFQGQEIGLAGQSVRVAMLSQALQCGRCGCGSPYDAGSLETWPGPPAMRNSCPRTGTDPVNERVPFPLHPEDPTKFREESGRRAVHQLPGALLDLDAVAICRPGLPSSQTCSEVPVPSDRTGGLGTPCSRTEGPPGHRQSRWVAQPLGIWATIQFFGGTESNFVLQIFATPDLKLETPYKVWPGMFLTKGKKRLGRGATCGNRANQKS